MIRVTNWWPSCPLNKFASLRKLLMQGVTMDWSFAEPGYRSDAFFLMATADIARERILPFMIVSERETCEDAFETPLEPSLRSEHIRENAWTTVYKDMPILYDFFYRPGTTFSPQLLPASWHRYIGRFNSPGGYPLTRFDTPSRIERLDCLGTDSSPKNSPNFVMFRKSLTALFNPKGLDYTDLRREVTQRFHNGTPRGVLQLKERRRIQVEGKDLFVHVFSPFKDPSARYLAWRKWDGGDYKVQVRDMGGGTIEEALGIKHRLTAMERLLSDEVEVEPEPDGGRGLG